MSFEELKAVTAQSLAQLYRSGTIEIAGESLHTIMCEATGFRTESDPQVKSKLAGAFVGVLNFLADEGFIEPIGERTGRGQTNFSRRFRIASKLLASPDAAQIGDDSSKKKLPISPDLIAFISYLKRVKPAKGLQAKAARDFCKKNGIRPAKSRSLMRQARSYPHLW